jgi:hypothetical protein
MAVMRDYLFQGLQMLLVLLLSPLLTGLVRKVKARLLRREGVRRHLGCSISSANLRQWTSVFVVG